MSTPLLPCLAGALAALALVPAHGASIVLDAKAECYDKAVVVDSQVGPFAQCDYSVNTTFPLRNIGTTEGTAKAIVGARSVGVQLEGTGDLNTQLNTGFGVVLTAKSEIQDTFIMDARFPDGTPVPSGNLHVSTLARGYVDFYGSNTLIDFSTAELRYTLLVGSFISGADDIMRFPTSSTNPLQVVEPTIAVIPWMFGQPIPIIMRAEATLDARLEASGSFHGMVEFGNSLDWLGIVSVTDEAGNPVASYSAISADTGVDWGAVVPEPSAATLCAAGLLALRCFARRR